MTGNEAGGPRDPWTVRATPTKEFFIHMLVRDVPLLRAVLDLVDNAVDGASRAGREDYSAFAVSLTIGADQFSIADNCGGIATEVAQTYAFRFGRPKSTVTAPSTIGQFGVGMKRSVFKIGKSFRVESTTAQSRFVVEEQVDEWLAKPDDDWDFRFREMSDERQAGPYGTRIDVTDLLGPVRETMELDGFQIALLEEIATAHALAISRGLTVKVNGVQAERRSFELVSSSEIGPVNVETVLDNGDGNVVNLRIFAGIADERNLMEGGWYVFCNGRMVLEADQGEQSGWGENKGKLLPKYHPDFAYFRGYAFFEAEDPSLLPWTTTKTGVDTDARVYKAARQKMILIAKPVTEFLRRLASEKHRKVREGVMETPLEDAIRAATAIPYERISPQLVFVAPSEEDIRSPPKVRHIQYNRPVEDVDRAMDALGARSLREVGEKTFDYYLQLECS